jgi:hypothetical protein
LKPEKGKQRLSVWTRIEAGMRTLFERRAAVRKTYQGTLGKSKRKFELLGSILVQIRSRADRFG